MNGKDKRDSFRVQFRGVRGSFPVPGPTTARTGGNTPCVEVRAGEHVVILDAGTGIVRLGEELRPPHGKGQSHLLVFITHVHHDHTQGLPFFRPQQEQTLTVHLYGPDSLRDFREALLENLSPPYFPISLNQLGGYPQFGVLSTGDRILLDVPWSPPTLLSETDKRRGTRQGDLVIKAYHCPRHPNGGVLTLRIEYRGRSMVYATDVEGVEGGDPSLADFARETDLLIHDAMYTDEEYQAGAPGVKGYGHSTVGMAVDTALMAEARRLALFHHEPRRTDDEIDAMEADAKKAFPGAFAAREDQVVELLGRARDPD